MAISVTTFILRIAVYFRDGYRASSYGVPDLVEIIQQIDKKYLEKEPKTKNDDGQLKRVELSFIGHSMGAYAVTGAVRILSNVFDDRSRRPDLNVRPGDLPASMSSEIGGVFLLKRLVLVSPDIPAETLISGRANFLSTSLLRFEEASLFSNEGDEVLRQISTTANYFSFPTTHNKFGYRLGNVCLRDIKYGITRDINLKKLQIGRESLHSIYSKMEKMGSDPLRDDLPKHFSYFDCTSCIENKQGGVEKGSGVLTLAKLGPAKKWGRLITSAFCFYILFGCGYTTSMGGISDHNS